MPLAITNTNLGRLTLAAALALLAGTSAGAQCGALKLIQNNAADGDRMGGPMAFSLNSVNESRLLVGMPDADQGAQFDAGKVKLFGRIGAQWGELSTILSPSGFENNKSFGAAVGYDGVRMIVGEPGRLANDGSAYIFEFQLGAWTPVATFNSAQGDARLGAAVAIDGDWAMLGSPDYDFDGNPNPGINNANSGLVTIVKRNPVTNAWTLAQSVFDNDFTGTFSNRRLGAALALKGDVAVAGAPEGTLIPSPTSHGYIKILRRDAGGTWNIEADDFAPLSRRAGANFGAAVATDGTRVIVGAPGYAYTLATEGVNVSDVGAAWILRSTAGVWNVEAKLTTPLPVSGVHFGSSVDIEGNRAVVGEPGSKRAYTFELVNGTWSLIRSYTDEDTAASGSFGSGVAISATNIFVGDVDDDNASATNPGAVYIKSLPAFYSDSCAGAQLYLGPTLNGCTLDSTPEPFMGSCTGNPLQATGAGVWVRWQPANDSIATISTVGSTFDTVLSVHSGCPDDGATNQITCNDDVGGGPLTSLVTFPAFAANTYLINLRGYGTGGGNFTMNFSTAPICPCDTDFSGTLTPSDIFAFLNIYFSNLPRADFDGNGLRQPADIFAYLNCYFGGCP